MNGQAKSFREKKLLAEQFIQETNPYEKGASLAFDLHAYSKYLADNNIRGINVTPEIMQQFVK